jgi:hypothetical protein
MSVSCDCGVLSGREVSAMGRCLFQRSPAECSVSECDSEDSIMRGPWPSRGCCALRKKKLGILITQVYTNLMSPPLK